MSEVRTSKLRLGLLALLGGITGGFVSGLVHDARAVDVKPGPQTAAFALNTTDAKVTVLEQKVAALEQKLAALRTAYDGHSHTYNAPAGGTHMNLTMLKQVMNDSPASYMLWLQAPGQSNFVDRSTSAPKAP
jgi:hypothetical protein